MRNFEEWINQFKFMKQLKPKDRKELLDNAFFNFRLKFRKLFDLVKNENTKNTIVLNLHTQIEKKEYKIIVLKDEKILNDYSLSQYKTYEDLNKYYEEQEAFAKITKSISKKLGLNRQLSQFENAYIEKWIKDFGYNMNIIEIALKKTTSKTNPNFDYINKILSDWHERGLKTPEAVEKFLADMKQKNKDIKNIEKQTGYNNYSQRSYSNFSDLYANNFNENNDSNSN